MNGIFFAFLGGLVTFTVTTLGAAGIFFVKRQISKNWQNGFLGFAGGVMIAASVWSLLLPGIEFAEENDQVDWLVITGGFLLGVMTLLTADFLLQKWYKRQRKKPITLKRSTSMLVLAITVHNIPEGMAVGVVYAGYLTGHAQITIMGAMALSIGIAIQNFPEGAIISMPLRSEGMGKTKAFAGGVLSGIVEPIGAVLTILAAGLIVPALPYLLSFAAGAMLYVVVEELIPEMSAGEHSNIGTIFFAVGFSLMMILDVALG